MTWPSPHKDWRTHADPALRRAALISYIADIEEEMGRATTAGHGYSRASAAGLGEIHRQALQALASIDAARAAGTRLVRFERY